MNSLQTEAIFTEAGHGKKQLLFAKVNDPGAVAGNLKEREFTKIIAEKLHKKLMAKREAGELGHTNIQGVGIVTDATIQEKMKFVNKVVNDNMFTPKKCVGVAIHMNSSTSPVPRGFEAWHQKNVVGSRELAQSLVDSWKKYGITPLRPKPVNNSKDSKYSRFYIDDTTVPYVIVEVSFISNAEDTKALMANYDRVAEAIAHGILEYLRR